MDDLRVRFRETTAIRLREMTSLLDVLDRDRSDLAALQLLARHFHALAGLGGTYGYPRVSELGDEGDQSMLPIVREGHVPAEGTVARWRELVGEVTRAMDGTSLC